MKYECTICSYIYDPEVGDFEDGIDIAAGTDFNKLPKDWVCPECGLNVRIGIKGNPEIRHSSCEKKTGRETFFVKSEDLTPNKN